MSMLQCVKDHSGESSFPVVTYYSCLFMLLLLFLAFHVLVANPKKRLYRVANPDRGLLNREKIK